MTGEAEGELASVWLRYAVERRGEDFWAWDQLTSLVFDQPEQAWTLLLRIIADAPVDRLGSIGAGPLEDLLREHGEAFGARIEEQARRDARFRAALSAVWLSRGSVPAALEARLQQLTGGRIRTMSGEA